MRAVLKHPASRHQILDVLTMFLATPKPAEIRSRWDTPPLVNPETWHRGFKYSTHPWTPSAPSSHGPSLAPSPGPTAPNALFSTMNPNSEDVLYPNFPGPRPQFFPTGPSPRSNFPTIDNPTAIDEMAIRDDLSKHIDSPSVPAASTRLFSDKFCRYACCLFLVVALVLTFASILEPLWSTHKKWRSFHRGDRPSTSCTAFRLKYSD
jgi:hypothetical protein